jgi:hypothetical protein
MWENLLGSVRSQTGRLNRQSEDVSYGCVLRMMVNPSYRRKMKIQFGRGVALDE